MANPLLGRVLESVFARSAAGYGQVAGLVSRLMGRGQPMGRLGALARNRDLLLAMLLPFAMRWVQRQGGVRSVLERFRQRGYGPHASTWLSTGENRPVQPEAIDQVVGHDELSQLAKQLGVKEEDVSSGFSEILPEVVDQLSPEGKLAPCADQALDAGLSKLEKELGEIQTGITP